MRTGLKHIIFVGALLGLMMGGAAFAQEDNPLSNGPVASSYEDNLRRWQAMTEQQREAIRQKVYAMDEKERQQIIENARQFSQLPKEEQLRIVNNYHRFQALSKADREALRANARRFQSLSAQERDVLRQKVMALNHHLADHPAIQPVIRENKPKEGFHQDAPQPQHDQRQDIVDRPDRARHQEGEHERVDRPDHHGRPGARPEGPGRFRNTPEHLHRGPGHGPRANGPGAHQMEGAPVVKKDIN